MFGKVIGKLCQKGNVPTLAGSASVNIGACLDIYLARYGGPCSEIDTHDVNGTYINLCVSKSLVSIDHLVHLVCDINIHIYQFLFDTVQTVVICFAVW